ncbi:MAG: elongation factor G [Clostridia bacterium]|nr:elongation factor G [Clostridia bacterium]
MAEFLANNIRNIALIGHGGEGKTTLAEAILFNAKVIDRQGKVDDGNTVMDYDAEEIARKISISLAIANCKYKDVKFNIIDVPGFFDFEGELVQALTVAGSALIVAGANGSLTVGTEKAVNYCTAHGVPAMIFINGMDKENVSFADTIEAIKAKYGTKIVPLMLPVLNGGKLAGYVNVIEAKAYDLTDTEIAIPADVKAQAEEIKAAIVESAAENDEELMMKYFEGEPLTTEEIAKGLKLGISGCTTIPVFLGAALSNKCIFNLMEQLIQHAPSAAEEKPVKDVSGEVELSCNDEGPMVVRIFKTVIDRFGKSSYFKVVSGVLKSGQTYYNSTKELEEKVSSVAFTVGKKQETVDCVHAGDIGVMPKLSNTQTGDTLCESGKNIILSKPELPSAVLSFAVYANKKGDEDKIFGGLGQLQNEDPSFCVTKNIETSEMLISGVGETQLNILCNKLKAKSGVEAVLKEPRIAYRETVKKTAEAEGKHKKQSGGAGQFGQCSVRFEPNYDSDFEFVDAVVGGAVPKQFIPAVEKGLREAIKKGVLAGYPMVSLRCTLFDGKYHPVDSKEIAFVTAAKLAYADGCMKAGPVILEPIYSMKITVPTDFMGDVYGDMNKRRGRIMGSETVGDNSVISAEAPLGEIMKYAIDLRSMTQGRGAYSIEFARYEEVPAMLTPKIIEDAKKMAEEKKDN